MAKSEWTAKPGRELNQTELRYVPLLPCARYLVCAAQHMDCNEVFATANCSGLMILYSRMRRHTPSAGLQLKLPQLQRERERKRDRRGSGIEANPLIGRNYSGNPEIICK